MGKGRRRGRQEGSIYQRTDGRWTAVVSAGYRNGKRVRKQVYGATRAEVQKKLTKTLNDQQLGLPIAAEKQTVAGFLRRWLENTAKPRLRPRTFADYAAIVERHLVPALGKLSLQKLGPEHVQELFRTKTEAGLSARRVWGSYVPSCTRRYIRRCSGVQSAGTSLTW
jgi:Phage integrase, N-terminal SAM-like domain